MVDALHFFVERFTPTRVGITVSVHTERRHHAVHPHTRGDYKTNFVALFKKSGSPPHAWGLLPALHAQRACRWFTPTRVGITTGEWFEQRV